jgi:hypothetical protein
MPDWDPLPDAAGASHGPDEEVGPESAQTSDCVCFGARLYVSANDTELVVSVAPSLGDGLTNVIAGRLLELAAEASAAPKPTSATATTVTSKIVRATERMRTG